MTETTWKKESYRIIKTGDYFVRECRLEYNQDKNSYTLAFLNTVVKESEACKFKEGDETWSIISSVLIERGHSIDIIKVTNTVEKEIVKLPQPKKDVSQSSTENISQLRACYERGFPVLSSILEYQSKILKELKELDEFVDEILGN